MTRTFSYVVPLSAQHAPGIYCVGKWFRVENEQFDEDPEVVNAAFKNVRELRGEIGRRASLNGLPVLVAEE